MDARLTPAAARSGTAEVVLHGNARQLADAVRSAKGRVLAAIGDAATAVVPAASLKTLAQQPGVGSVSPSVRGQVQVQSEGVHASNADAWHSASTPLNGSGVKVGIVDAGFANLAAEEAGASPNLPASLVHYIDNPADPDNQNHCADESATSHGTAVAEIVHQMAPGAELYLYCIDDNVGFKQAGSQLQASGVTVVNSSLAFPGDSRGDGTGVPASAAATVRTARQNGILWVESAGNNGEDHWPGTFTDANHDTFVDLVDSSNYDDAVGVGLNGGGGLILLQWDKWPTSTLGVTLHAWQFDEATNNYIGNPVSITHTSGAAPLLCLEYQAVAGDGCGTLPDPGSYGVWISMPAAAQGVHYDLSYWATSTATISPAARGTGTCAWVRAPARSPGPSMSQQARRTPWRSVLSMQCRSPAVVPAAPMRTWAAPSRWNSSVRKARLSTAA